MSNLIRFRIGSAAQQRIATKMVEVGHDGMLEIHGADGVAVAEAITAAKAGARGASVSIGVALIEAATDLLNCEIVAAREDCENMRWWADYCAITRDEERGLISAERQIRRKDQKMRGW
jgi:hypothetical protein